MRLLGSAANGRFRELESDLDFLVDFLPGAPKGMAPYLALQADLERITGRGVDLVESRAVRNPYFAEQAISEAQELYAV